MTPRLRLLVVLIGQSNWQGAAYTESGAQPARYRSRYNGQADPLPGCNNINQGGSCIPYLIDLCADRGIQIDALNYAIGGASIYHYTGRVGATVSGGLASLPASQGYMDPVGLSGGAAVCVEGDPDFDPVSLLSRTRAAIAARTAAVGYDAVISYWVNGESDAGLSAASYSAAQQSIANYMLASGVSRHFIGMTSKQATATTGQFDILEQGVDLAVAALASTGRVARGHSMYAYYGSNPPLYPETSGSYVHMTLRGQEVQAKLVNEVLRAAGY